MSEQLLIRRRVRKRSPMRSRRVGAALAASGAAPSEVFPGIHFIEAQGGARNLVGGSLAVVVHAGLIAALLLAAALAPEIEDIIEDIKIVRPEPEEPAPAPRVIAESRAPFDPAPQQIDPQILNPKVITETVPNLRAEKLQISDAPELVRPQAFNSVKIAVDHVVAYRPADPAAPVPRTFDFSVSNAIRGPVETVAPVSPSAGPRAIAAPGQSIGTAVRSLGTGSSVRDGVASGRDVLGAADGPRLADVRTRVGESFLHGGGGDGLGPGSVSFEDCMARPAVQRYWSMIKDRTLSRWVLPPNVAANQAVVLRFILDPSGSASNVDLSTAPDARLGQSCVLALRSASPFPAMPDHVRCLAGHTLIATFRNPESTVAN